MMGSWVKPYSQDIRRCNLPCQGVCTVKPFSSQELQTFYRGRWSASRRRGTRRLQFIAYSNQPGEQLASEFSKYVNDSGISEPMRYRRPTPMIPPHLAVQSVMSALQMNDYPEENSGSQIAFLFSKPYECERLVAGQGSPERARSWAAREDWLAKDKFSEMLASAPYSVLLDCSSWKAVSPVRFPSKRMENKALQTISVSPRQGRKQPFLFTFCLERIEQGPYKGCWLIVGLREGDYASHM